MAAEATLDDLRRYAVARTLFKPTTLARAIDRLGFVQADPIRAPARAQDLILRHRVAGYRAGDLERRYPRLADRRGLPGQLRLRAAPGARADASAHRRQAVGRRDAQARRGAARLHPRPGADPSARSRSAVRARPAHQRLGRLEQRDDASARRHALPRPAARRAARQRRRASTRRSSTSPSMPARRRATPAPTALLDLVVAKYAPLPASSFVYLARLLGYGAPHLQAETRSAVAAARERLASVKIDGVTWYWPADENPRSRAMEGRRARSPARALRPGRLGSAPLRAALGLDLSLRGLHAGAEANARLLRAAAAVARCGRSAGRTRRWPTAGSPCRRTSSGPLPETRRSGAS